LTAFPWRSFVVDRNDALSFIGRTKLSPPDDISFGRAVA